MSVPTAADSTPGVYVSLNELVRLGPASRGLTFRAQQSANSILGGRNASRLRGRGLDFEEMRAYQPGDDIRAIDWRVTARTRSPYVRVYREEKERPVLIVLDQRASMFFGSVRDMKSVTAARAAALVAHRVVAAGDRVGAIIFGDQKSDVLAPQRSGRQVMRILGVTASFNRALGHDSPAPHASALDEALGRVLRLATHDHLVVLVSDLFGASDATRKLATEIRRRNDVLVLWIHDPLEAQLPDVGQAVLGNGDLQVQVNTTSSAVRKRFADDASERKERAASFALRYDVPFVPLGTEEDALPQLRRHLVQFSPSRRV